MKGGIAPHCAIGAPCLFRVRAISGGKAPRAVYTAPRLTRPKFTFFFPRCRIQHEVQTTFEKKIVTFGMLTMSKTVYL